MRADAAPGPPGLEPNARRGWVLGLTVLAVCVPILVAAAVLAVRGWTPVGEFAQAELRIRDFWDHPPTLGAVGRLRTDTDVSSHPGPALWWLAYPFYAIGGRGAVALSTAVAASACVWITAALGVVWRRAGDVLTVLLGAAMLVLVAGLGPSVFVEPWNPWFALMAFVAMLVAVWAVGDGSRWSLLLATAAGTYCVQAHMGYAPIVSLLGLLALFGMWRSGPRSDGAWRPLLWPLGASGLLALAMWLPPIVEQLTGDPGNIGILLSAYGAARGTEAELGLTGAVKLVSAYLDPRAGALLLGDGVPTARGPSLVTALFAAVWVLAAVVAGRRRDVAGMRGAIRLQVVVVA
ncbi:MAG: hypothetical protein ACR2OH_06305, partial [Microthrixaceae bacterium]